MVFPKLVHCNQTLRTGNLNNSAATTLRLLVLRLHLSHLKTGRLRLMAPLLNDSSTQNQSVGKPNPQSAFYFTPGPGSPVDYDFQINYIYICRHPNRTQP